MTVSVGVTVMETQARSRKAKCVWREGVLQLQHTPPPAHWAQGLGERKVIDNGARTTSRQEPSAQRCLAEQ